MPRVCACIVAPGQRAAGLAAATRPLPCRPSPCLPCSTLHALAGCCLLAAFPTSHWLGWLSCCAQGVDKLNGLVAEAMREAHSKSVEGMKARMRTLASNLGMPSPPN